MVVNNIGGNNASRTPSMISEEEPSTMEEDQQQQAGGEGGRGGEEEEEETSFESEFMQVLGRLQEVIERWVRGDLKGKRKKENSKIMPN